MTASKSPPAAPLAGPDHPLDGPAAPPAPLALARGVAVSVGPSVVLDLCVAGSIVAAIRALRGRPPARPLGPLVALGAAFPLVYALVLEPWMRRWGATDEELARPLPGDERVPDPGYQHTRAVTVDAPTETVWPWLAQIGQARGGLYSYDWLENLAGCGIDSADAVHPEWQLRVGDRVDVMPGFGPRVVAVEPGFALVIEGWGTYAVVPRDPRSCRVLARARQPRGAATVAYRLITEIPHFVMERAMLLGLKARAERAAGACGDGPGRANRLPGARPERP